LKPYSAALEAVPTFVTSVQTTVRHVSRDRIGNFDGFRNTRTLIEHRAVRGFDAGDKPCALRPRAAIGEHGVGEAKIAQRHFGAAHEVGWLLRHITKSGPLHHVRKFLEPDLQSETGRAVIFSLNQREPQRHGLFVLGSGAFAAPLAQCAGGRAHHHFGIVHRGIHHAAAGEMSAFKRRVVDKRKHGSAEGTL
jgi:hypothetical protein